MDTSLSPLNQTQAQLDANAQNLAYNNTPSSGGFDLLAGISKLFGNQAADVFPDANYGGQFDAGAAISKALGNDSADVFPNYDSRDLTTPIINTGAPAPTPIYDTTTPITDTTYDANGNLISGGSGGGYTAPYVAPDPYAQWADYGMNNGLTNFNNLVSGFNTQLGGITSTAGNSATNLQGGLNQSVLDTLKNYGRSQEGINKLNVQNESSKIQGGRDIMGMVGRGIKSGGVMLANRNAGNSSAAEAIANAYGQLGQRQLSSVNNQYLMNAEDVGLKQKYLKEDIAATPATFHEGIMQNVNSIVSAAQTSLYTLDAQMASASMPDRIAIEQEKEKIKTDALSKLSQYDTQLTTGLGKIAPTTTGANRTTANTQLTAGQADPNLFKYSTQTPSQFQNTGPFASELPIFTYPYNKTKQTA